MKIDVEALIKATGYNEQKYNEIQFLKEALEKKFLPESFLSFTKKSLDSINHDEFPTKDEVIALLLEAAEKISGVKYIPDNNKPIEILNSEKSTLSKSKKMTKNHTKKKSENKNINTPSERSDEDIERLLKDALSNRCSKILKIDSFKSNDASRAEEIIQRLIESGEFMIVKKSGRGKMSANTYGITSEENIQIYNQNELNSKKSKDDKLKMKQDAKELAKSE